jgi:hypothetical protein
MDYLMVLRTKFYMNITGKPVPGYIWLALSVVLLFSILLASCSAVNPDPFVMVAGDEQLLVLMRNEKDGLYQVRYEGRQPTQLQSLHVMLGGQILHVDVVEVAIIQNSAEVILKGDMSIPEGSQVVFQPGEEFEVRVTYHGQSLGGNYMYGFRIVHGDDPEAESVELIAEYDYAVIVE